MGSFTSLSQIAHSALNKAKSQQRLIARKIATDGETPWKLKKLEKAEKQVETASNYLIQAMEQDMENSKKFLDSLEETSNRIKEEAEKAQEEKAVEESKEKAETENNTDGSQNTEGNAETGTIVDITIPSTVVSTDAITNKADDSNKDASIVNTSA